MSTIFNITEQSTGWFVGTSGPFLSQDRAIALANGMISSLRALGATADVALLDDNAAPATPKSITRILYLDC